MTPSTLPGFAVAFAAALVVAAALAAWRRRVDGRGRLLDLSGPVTLIGVAVGLAALMDSEAQRALGVVTLWAAGLVVLGVFVDQGRAPALLRTALIVVAGVALAHAGVRIETLKVPFTVRFVELGAVAPLVTMVWLLVFATVFGRAATIPGVPAGVAAAAGLTFWAICALRPDLTSPQGAAFGALVAGACLPQLAFARDLQSGGATSGGYVVGFLVGVASIMGALKNTALLVAVVPLIVVGAPLFAAGYAFAADLRAGWRAVAVAERRRHLHEILLEQGYTPRQVLQVILAGTVYLSALALLLVLMLTVSFAVKLLLIAVALLGGLAFFYVVLRMMRRPAPAAETGGPEAVSILGVRLHAVTMAQALAEAERFIREDKPHMIVTTDATGLMRAHDDAEFRRIVNEADLVTPDGAGVVLSARLLNIPLEARCAGCDMVVGLCEVAARLGRSVYLLGAAPGVAEKAAGKLREQVPGLQVAGCRDGYFADEQEPAIVEEIRRARPGVLFVALGIPRQEQWIRRHLEQLNVPVCVGVGGSFDVISGLKQRAPVWMQRAGLEWLYRVAKEPRRLPRLAALPRIVLLSFAELLRPPRSVQQERGEDRIDDAAGDRVEDRTEDTKRHGES